VTERTVINYFTTSRAPPPKKKITPAGRGFDLICDPPRRLRPCASAARRLTRVSRTHWALRLGRFSCAPNAARPSLPISVAHKEVARPICKHGAAAADLRGRVGEEVQLGGITSAATCGLALACRPNKAYFYPEGGRGLFRDLLPPGPPPLFDTFETVETRVGLRSMRA